MTTLIVGYARTPFVKFNGKFAALSAVELGAHALKAALSRATIDAKDVDFVFAGQVLQAAAGQNPARHGGAGAACARSLSWGDGALAPISY